MGADAGVGASSAIEVKNGLSGGVGVQVVGNALDNPTDLQNGLVCYFPFYGDGADYSGNGNHTVPLASSFERILAVEVNPRLVEACRFNLALNGTLSRTLLTSGTTLLALLAIFFLGGPVLRGMSFALIWGVLIGTYSSIFIASTIVLALGMDLTKKPVEDVPGFQG